MNLIALWRLQRWVRRTAVRLVCFVNGHRYDATKLRPGRWFYSCRRCLKTMTVG